MLMTAIYNILSKKELYNPDLYRKSDSDPVDHEKAAIQLLEKRGFAVVPPPVT